MVSVVELFVRVAGEDPVIQGLVGGIVIATLNLFGASLVLVWRDPSERALDGALGFAAGVMLAAAFTSLIIPGIEQYSGGNPIPTLVGVALGAAFLDRADGIVPHAHYLLTGSKRPDEANPSTSLPLDNERLTPVVLFILAITLHNMPEGLAVGVGFGSGNIENAIPLMIAIGIQNVPEGLAVSVAAINAGLDRRFYAAFAGVRSGIVEIPLAVVGALAVSVAEPILPYAMGFAAGAMLFVISDEIIPETHTRGYERIATLGLMAGTIVMLYLDVSLG
ncbi:ZIP family metal transporter [Natrinema longum]|uniref:ZIP family metal transporter n=1 Tax=Natrinema longum TaxID=370324 RepID=A0A8A2UA93_9EURY|nr:ZIP family metal transporter [Natrinema longum]MBZ6493845.1 ZIP family metal transporter [Natrinema longum]QSW84818.1 ZIP family metal transporter [Natrinema longum]